MRNAIILSLAAAGIAFTAASSIAAEATHPAARDWSFNGVFGTFDRGALQRGYQVYAEGCAGCHSLRLLAYRNLAAIGFNEAQIKKIAAEAEVSDGPNDAGEMYQRPAKPNDRFVPPFPNANAARAANNGALPPDLSLITKARAGGADYVHAILTGYRDAPKDMQLGEGMNYNPYFPGNAIAMPPPLSADQVEYADKTKATVGRMAEDVTTFLTWAAEPELEERKRLGIKVLLFLLVLTGMLYALKRKIWADLH